MKSKKVLTVLLVLLTVFSLAACSGSSQEPTDAPAAPIEQPVDEEPAEESAGEKSGSAAVSDLSGVKNAVIQIEAQGTFLDPDFVEYSGAGRGSGFIIDPSGLAITNNHVVTGAALLKVWIGGDTSKSYNAQILAVSECSDLALIDIEGDGFPYLEWYSGDITVGLEVYAAGFPLGDPEFTLTKGIVSKEEADGESDWASVNQVIEHDATINPGNSGGPLVTADGKIVGVNYASYAAAGQYFAIGRDVTLPIIESFKNGDDVDSLGINGVAVLSSDGSFSGIWVSSVKSGSSADKAGIVPGDVVTFLENLPLATDGTMQTYCDIIRTQGDESTLSIEVMRYDTNELLVGQFNGRPLEYSASLISSGDGGPVNNAGGASAGTPPIDEPVNYESPYILDVFDDGYMAVTDDYGAVYLEVPTSWNQIDGTLWADYWGDLYFEAADVAVAPDLDGFLSYYDYPGVRFSASEDWGAIGGYIQLLDGVKHWYEDNCSWEWREDYIDPVYEGAYDFWECGRDAGVVVIGARPIAAPTAYLVLVQIQVVSDADIATMERIMDTFDLVDGYLP